MTGWRIMVALLGLVGLVSACSASSSADLVRAAAPVPPPERATSVTTPFVPPGPLSARPVAVPAVAATLDPLPQPTQPLAVRTLPTEVFQPVEASTANTEAPWAPPVTGQIEIPKIGLLHTTYEGHTLASIDYGPSHWPGTAMPGQVGNTVFPGHRSTHTQPFYYIHELEPGDPVIFRTRAGTFTYEVTHAFTVEPRDVWIVEPTEDPTFTIFACHPIGSTEQRFVVKGELVHSVLVDPDSAEAAGYHVAEPPAPETTTTTSPPRGPLSGLLQREG